MPSDNIPTTVGKVATSFFTVMPPAFIMMSVILIACFMSVLWFETRQSEQRLKILMMAFEACPSLRVTPQHP